MKTTTTILMFSLALMTSTFSIACGGEAPGTTGDDANITGDEGTSDKNVDGASIVVWSDKGVTYQLADDGTVLRKQGAHQFFASKGTNLQELVFEAETKKLPACEGVAKPSALATSLSFFDPESGDKKEILGKAEPTGAASQDFKQTIEIVGLVESYIFIRETRSEMGCGTAHPMGNVLTTLVWDTTKHEKTILQTPNANVLQQTALEKLKADGVEATTASFAEIIPSFDDEGTLSFKYRFETEVCTGCTDGIGNGGTRSAIVDGRSPIENMSTKAPKAVTALLAKEPGLKIKGWGALGK